MVQDKATSFRRKHPLSVVWLWGDVHQNFPQTLISLHISNKLWQLSNIPRIYLSVIHVWIHNTLRLLYPFPSHTATQNLTLFGFHPLGSNSHAWLNPQELLWIGHSQLLFRSITIQVMIKRMPVNRHLHFVCAALSSWLMMSYWANKGYRKSLNLEKFLSWLQYDNKKKSVII